MAAALLAGAGSWGCASGPAGEKRAFLEAGRQVKLSQPPPTNAELRRDLDSFLENDLSLTFDEAKAKESRDGTTWKIVGGVGGATVLAGATAGSLKDDSAAQAAVIGGGVALMAVAAFEYFGPVAKLHECQEFLSLEGARLRSWGERNLNDSIEPVSAKTWREYVDLVSETQLHPNCLTVR